MAPDGERSDVDRAIAAVVERFAGAARRLVWRAGLTADDLDDLLQETRIRLWRALGTAEKIREVRPFYLQRVVLSAAVDLIRRRRARREQPLDAVDDAAVGDASHERFVPGAGAALDVAELDAAVERALDTLVLSRRTVVRLHLAGYGREEIATMLGWTEAKTRNLLYRGLDDLRQALSRAGIDAPTHS